MATGWFENTDFKVINVLHAPMWRIFDHDFFKHCAEVRTIDLRRPDYGGDIHDAQYYINEFEQYKNDPTLDLREVVVMTYDKETESQEIFFKGWAFYLKKSDSIFEIYIFKNNKCDAENFIGSIGY